MEEMEKKRKRKETQNMWVKMKEKKMSDLT